MSRHSTTLGIGIVALVVGCSGADEHPLGGPYGGSASAVSGPTKGSAGGSASNGAAADDTTDDPTASQDNPDGTSPPKSPSSPKPGSDAGAPPQNGNAPTWTALYTQYLAAGTVGDCGSCHSGMRTAAGAFTYLKRKGQVGSASPGLADPNVSCLSWLGGDMPPNGPSSDAKATADLKAWANAGAQQN